MKHCIHAFALGALALPGTAWSQAMHDHSTHSPPPAPQAAAPVHDHSKMGSPALSTNAPLPTPAMAGPRYAADGVYDPAEMARSRAQLTREHGRMTVVKVLVDHLEISPRGKHTELKWDAEAWVGTDEDRLWLQSEGDIELANGNGEGDIQARWSHAIDPWFDLQLGIRHEFSGRPERTQLVAGLHGSTPYWIELDTALFLSTKGELTARIEAEFDLRITQKLILQPSLELGFSAQSIPERRQGGGLTDAILGMRLRYQLTPRFAPYAGVEWHTKIGETRRMERVAGEAGSEGKFVLGVRFWF